MQPTQRAQVFQKHQKRVALLVTSTTLALSLAMGVALKDVLIDRWYVWRLGSEDNGVVRHALSEVKRRRAVAALPPLLELLSDETLQERAYEDDSLYANVIEGLELLAPLAGYKEQEATVLTLLEAGSTHWAASELLRGIGPKLPGGFAALLRDFSHGESEHSISSDAILFDAWPASAKLLRGYIAKARCAEIEKLLGSAYGFEAICEELTAFVVEEHPDPIVRCHFLSAMIAARPQDAGRLLVMILNAQGPPESPSPLYREAIRVCGFYGPFDYGPDLRRALFDHSDESILAEIVLARAEWARSDRFIDLPSDLQAAAAWQKPRPWGTDEIERLEEILRTAVTGELRHVTAQAIATERRHQTPQASALSAHEWSVGRVLSPGDPPFGFADELPEFAEHRLATTCEIPSIVFRSAIAFHTEIPLTTNLAVHAIDGNFGTTYPKPPCTRFSGSGVPSLSKAAVRVNNIETDSAVHHGCDVDRTQLPYTDDLISWCGLRIGFDRRLESTFEDVDSQVWWKDLRAFGNVPLAIGSECEKAILYEALLNILPPLEVIQRNQSDSLLVLRAQRWWDIEHYQWIPRYEKRLKKRAEELVPVAFVVVKNEGQPPVGAVRHRIRDEIIVDLSDLELEGKQLLSAFEAEVQARGFTDAETQAFLKLWSPSFFETTGRRVISFSPRSYLDAVLKLEMHPPPNEWVRLGVIWKELPVETDSEKH